MVLSFLILSALCLLPASLARGRRGIVAAAACFYAVQAALVVWVALKGRGATALHYFTFDELGLLFHGLMAVISPIVFYQSIGYLDTEPAREVRLYHLSLAGLCLAATGVYYANNAAATWVFLEATTLATAGLVYHRRSIRSLEAVWKYVFVSSVGIAVAYLGVLMLGTAVTGPEGLSYAHLRAAMAGANPLYMKMAFLFILTGYSCKMETFPLYTVGVDANYAAPTPASALISTALVGSGFVAFFRIYHLMQPSPVHEWTRSVLILTGLVSVLIAAVYLRRTNNFKRLLAYSTVENMGIVLLGLGIGGAGLWAALFHLTAHSLLKSGLFMQIGVVGRLYGTYRMNRLGGYLDRYAPGAVAAGLGAVGLLAFPPSGLFVSELLIVKGFVAGGRWVTLVLFTLMICVVIYSLARRFAALLWKPAAAEPTPPPVASKVATCLQLALIGAAFALGFARGGWLTALVDSIVNGFYGS